MLHGSEDFLFWMKKYIVLYYPLATIYKLDEKYDFPMWINYIYIFFNTWYKKSFQKKLFISKLSTLSFLISINIFLKRILTSFFIYIYIVNVDYLINHRLNQFHSNILETIDNTY